MLLMRLRINSYLSVVVLTVVLLTMSGFALPGLAQKTVPAAERAAANHTMPHLVEKDGRHALFVDGAPYLMLGAQVNNSSAWPAELPKVWPTAEFLHQNTIEMPIYWEQFEPERGHYDPSLLHALLAGAREHHLHLVLLWFGTWKNGSGHYTPNFIKLDEADVPHVVNKDGHKVDSLAPYSQLALDADKEAFAELMKELKAADPQHTVIMVQVENESGTYGSDRDYSPAANKLFAENVPDTVLQAMKKTAGGSWQQVFGDDAAEYFHAYSIAHFINQVAAAGKAQYALPMYVNVALRDPFHPGHAGGYASGGPTDNVIPIWKAAAPAIDLIAPDIYMGEYDKYIKELDLYARRDNALLVPETANFPAFARYFYAALGHGAIGFAPFGMDTTGYVNAPNGAPKVSDEQLEPFALNYRIFEPMDRLIAELNFEGKVKGVSEDPAVHRQTLDFTGWQAVVSYGLPQFGGFKAAPGNDPPDGGAMIAQLGPNEFLVTGVHARVDFIPADPAKQRQFVVVQEGSYQNNAWKSLRIWNGDQTDYGLNFTAAEQVLKVTLATY
jgi:beta-galactosidase GanA